MIIVIRASAGNGMDVHVTDTWEYQHCPLTNMDISSKNDVHVNLVRFLLSKIPFPPKAPSQYVSFNFGVITHPFSDGSLPQRRVDWMRAQRVFIANMLRWNE